MRKLNILMALLGILLIADLIVFGVVAFSDSEQQVADNFDIIRIGMVTDLDHPEDRKVVDDFFREIGSQGEFELRPCYSSSYGEAVAGFIHGSVDLLVINPACFLMLREKFNAKVLVRQRFSQSENAYNHSVLMTTHKIGSILDTKGMRITYKDRYSMGGYLVPSHHIANQLRDTAPEKWFKSISFSDADHLSLKSLLEGKTDIIAVDLLSLVNNELYRENARKINMFWISPGLPETVICVSFQSEYFAKTELLQKISSTLWALSRRDPVFNRNSMFFEPVDYKFEGELKKLDDYLKSSKTESGVL